MVRATAAEIVKLTGGYPAGWDVTSVGDLCPDVDYSLDGYVKTHYNVTLSTTDTDAISIANALGVRKLIHGMWVQAGGPMSRQPEPVIFTDEIKMRIEAVLSSQTNYLAAVVDTIQ